LRGRVLWDNVPWDNVALSGNPAETAMFARIPITTDGNPKGLLETAIKTESPTRNTGLRADKRTLETFCETAANYNPLPRSCWRPLP
jgi:hypothetical protein